MTLPQLNEKNESSPNAKPIMYEGFVKTLINSQRYKDLYKSKEAIIAMLLAIVSTYFIYRVYNSVEIEILNEIIRNITAIGISGIMGLLGIVISGLTFTAGSMNIKITAKLVKSDSVYLLIDIFFSFKFIGVVMGAEIFLLVISYLLSYIDILATTSRIIICGLVTTYLFWFSVCYCIGLLGTCINTFLLNYNLDDSNKNNKDSI